MHILYDGTIYSAQAVGGISRYFASIISRLPLDFTPSVVVGEPLTGKLPHHEKLEVRRYGSSKLNLLSYRLDIAHQRVKDAMLRRNVVARKFDLLHPTYYTLLSGNLIRSYHFPVVLTVWDMIHELFASEIDPMGHHAEEKRQAVLAAEKIICISQSTKNDLLERIRIEESKVHVIHLAAGVDESLSHGDEAVPPQPYYFYVGDRTGYKNFPTLLKAFADASSQRPELSLCVVGSPFKPEELELMNRLKIADRIQCFGQVTDPQLAKLYRCSLALVYPSLYEGFGIPPLEAMACGTVAVVGNTSSLPEVVGDAGVMFDPKSPQELADVMVWLLDHSTDRETLISKGRERAKNFSWDKTAAQTVDVYRSLSN